MQETEQGEEGRQHSTAGDTEMSLKTCKFLYSMLVLKLFGAD